MPKTTSTPTRSRASTRACAPVTRTGAECGWCDRDAAGEAPPGWAGPGAAPPAAEAGWPGPPGWAGLPTTGADRGGAGLAAAVRAGMSSGEGACALEGTGLLCSVIGWLPCQDVRGCCLPGDAPSSEGALKNPSCRVAVEGRAQELDWSALCAPAKYENEVPLHGIHTRPPAGLPSNYLGCCLTFRDNMSE